jgi:hypothetical protein
LDERSGHDSADSSVDLAAIHRIIDRLEALLDHMRALAGLGGRPVFDDPRDTPVNVSRKADALPAVPETADA